jgi:hypothetical protein
MRGVQVDRRTTIMSASGCGAQGRRVDGTRGDQRVAVPLFTRTLGNRSESEALASSERFCTNDAPDGAVGERR